MNFFFLASLVTVVSIASSCQTYPSNSQEYIQTYSLDELNTTIPIGFHQVTKISDGDTFWCVNHKNEKVKIRFIGIDSPESRNAFKKKKQPFGKEASAFTSNLIMDKFVKLTFDIDSLDPFGRTLAYVYLQDGTFVNEEIIRNGFATIMTVAPNVKFENKFIKAQRYARERKLGMWGLAIE
ncbi:thermonuclease family protein [Sphingobacterium hungaricum]